MRSSFRRRVGADIFVYAGFRINFVERKRTETVDRLSDNPFSRKKAAKVNTALPNTQTSFSVSVFVFNHVVSERFFRFFFSLRSSAGSRKNGLRRFRFRPRTPYGHRFATLSVSSSLFVRGGFNPPLRVGSSVYFG